MRSHKTRSTRDRSIPRSLQKMSFDEILGLQLTFYFTFYEVLSIHVRIYIADEKEAKRRHNNAIRLRVEEACGVPTCGENYG